MAETIVITGLGSVSALGTDTQSFWHGLIQGRAGIRHLSGIDMEGLRVTIGAQLPAYDPAKYFTPPELALLDPFSQYALIAAREAVADAKLQPQSIARAAAVIGTGCGGKSTDELTYQHLYKLGRTRTHPLTIPKGMPSAAASQVSMSLGIQGPVFSVSSACSSAGHAICQAAAMIRVGLVDLAICGGTDAPFTYGLVKAWEALRVLARDTCRPFSTGRTGLVLGEGAGILVLESLRSARERGGLIYAELAGCGMSSDAAHITDPSPYGAIQAMRSALRDAGLATTQVDYVNAHGTGTIANDVSETYALRQVFGKHAENLSVSSTKSMHGHALGASGALELIATVKALQTGIVPPTANFTTPGEGCDLDYVPNKAREQMISAALSNSFAFGGLNAVLVVRAWASDSGQ